MKRELHIGPGPVDAGPWPAPGTDATRAENGAAITFFGIVRGTEAGAPIAALEYEAFEAMAAHQFHKLFDQVEEQWPTVAALRLIHRLGAVAAGEPSLRVDVLARRRGEAFAACQWLIDEMKRVVPIWKRPLPPSPDAPGVL